MAIHRGAFLSTFLSIAAVGTAQAASPPGVLQFDSNSIVIDEASGVAKVAVVRTLGNAGTVSVRVSSNDGTAAAGQDYGALVTSVTFAAGDSIPKTVFVAITNDTGGEIDEAFQLALSSPTGGAKLGPNATTTLTIVDDDAPGSPALAVNAGLKQLQFSWERVPGASSYRLFESPDGFSGFSQVGADLPADATSTALPIAVHRHDWLHALYRLEACNSHGCTGSSATPSMSAMLDAIGYFKASNTGSGDSFGASVALSADGNTLAVGAPHEDSNATGVNQDQSNDTSMLAGAVYVFTRMADHWVQQAYIKASNTDAGDQFGSSVSLSANGDTLAVGAQYEDGATNAVPNAGAAYVFKRVGDAWSQHAYLQALHADAGDRFGFRVALDAGGDTLAVGALDEDGNGTGVDADQLDDSATNSGAAYVFAEVLGKWQQQAYLKASNTDAADSFGFAIAISGDGSTVAVGADRESGNGTSEGDNSLSGSGAAYVFKRNATQWTFADYVKAPKPDQFDNFGTSLALDHAGNFLAVGAPGEDSIAGGVDGDQSNNQLHEAGAAYLFARTGSQWAIATYFKASTPGFHDGFGISVALDENATTLAVGGWSEDSSATGIGGNQTNDAAYFAGATYLFSRGISWSQQSYVKASNTRASMAFGASVALSADANTLAVSGPGETSDATGVDGDQTNDSLTAAGAVYLY